MTYFGGVEGGSTASTFVILNCQGQTLATVIGPATNPLLIGENECFLRLSNLAEQAKLAANLPVEKPLDSIGLCLSGCITEEECRSFSESFLATYPQVSKQCISANDLVGPVYTANVKAGIVLISGTGSNSLLFNNENVVTTCGGWGHLFGDEGSAYWIAWRAYKTLLDDNDNYDACRYDTKRLRQVICDHFKLSNENLIGGFYQQNDKKKFASLSKVLYNSTKASKDPAIDDIFRQAGHNLARKVLALLTRAEGLCLDSGLNIICVGSVFNSWDLLESGFVDLLVKRIKSFRLLKLKLSSAHGAARFGARLLNLDLDLGRTTELLFAYSATSTGYQANGRHVLSIGSRNGFKPHNGNSNGRVLNERNDDETNTATCSVM